MPKPFVVSPNDRSWVDTPADHDFPIQNLPFFLATHESRVDAEDPRDPHRFVAIGEFGLDLEQVIRHKHELGLADLDEVGAFEAGTSVELLDSDLRELRRAAHKLLRSDEKALRENAKLRRRCLIPIEQLLFDLPVFPTHFVDFYSGIYHAERVARIFGRGDLPEAYRHIPLAYNGFGFNVQTSPQYVERPLGVARQGEDFVYGPTSELDFELELGAFLREAAVSDDEATDVRDMILGYVLVNDWSARDFQRLESKPLGPFLGKAFCTGVGAFLVHPDALEPFRVEGMDQVPAPPAHLAKGPRDHFDLELRVYLVPDGSDQVTEICATNTQNLYWSFPQQIAHLIAGGMTPPVGALLASGTISGRAPEQAGCLLERTQAGAEPLRLANGETRTYLRDGDRLVMEAFAQGDGFQIGFGRLDAIIQPPAESPSAL